KSAIRVVTPNPTPTAARRPRRSRSPSRRAGPTRTTARRTARGRRNRPGRLGAASLAGGRCSSKWAAAASGAARLASMLLTGREGRHGGRSSLLDGGGRLTTAQTATLTDPSHSERIPCVQRVGGDRMPKYLFRATYTADGAKGLI